MTTFRKNYKNKLWVFGTILFSIFTLSCDNQSLDANDNALDDDELKAEIEKFAGSGQQTFMISSALLTNAEVSDLDITGLFNVKDDEFVFSTEGNGDLKLSWHEGFGINANASERETVLSDTRASSKIENLIFESEDFSFVSASYKFTTTDEIISGKLSVAGGAELDVVLRKKTSDDYLLPPTSLDVAEELLMIENTSYWSGLRGSIAQNKLFFNNFTWPIGSGDQKAYVFDLNTNSLNVTNYTQEDHPWINLEIIDNHIYNVGGSFYQRFDFNFDTVLETNEIVNSIWDFGSAAQDDEIYLFAGALTSLTLSEVGKYDISDGVVDIIGSLPIRKNFADGEIVNNKLYIFGGQTTQYNTESFENMIFDMDSGGTEIFTTEAYLTSVSTAVVANIIYVGGARALDTDNDGNIDVRVPHLSAFNTQNNSTEEIDINFPLLENEFIRKIWASEDFIYMVLTQDIFQANVGHNLRIVRSPIN